MKKIYFILIVVILFCGCTIIDNMKVDEISDEEYDNQRIKLPEAFINAYIEKNIDDMKLIVSERFSFHNGEIDMKSDDPNMRYGTAIIVGENLDYQFDSSFEARDYYYYIYELNEKDVTSNFKKFKIQLGIKKINDYWKIDDFMEILE